MNREIDTTCTLLEQCAQELVGSVNRELERLNVSPTASSSSVGSQPLKLLGIAGLAIGIVGALVSSNSSWPYLIGGAGLLALGVGVMKKEEQAPAPPEHQQLKADGLDCYKLGNRLIEITEEIERRWTDQVEQAKAKVQQAINSSSLSEEQKRSLMEDTYLTKRVSVSYGEMLDGLERSSQEAIGSVVKTYGSTLIEAILKASSSQAEIYRNISAQL